MITTTDSDIVIEDVGPGWVVYWRLSDGSRWTIRGVCNQCGECEEGGANPNVVWTGKPVGEAEACYDVTYGTRRDVPVQIGFTQRARFCTLKGEWL